MIYIFAYLAFGGSPAMKSSMLRCRDNLNVVEHYETPNNDAVSIAVTCCLPVSVSHSLSIVGSNNNTFLKVAAVEELAICTLAL